MTTKELSLIAALFILASSCFALGYTLKRDNYSLGWDQAIVAVKADRSNFCRQPHKKKSYIMRGKLQQAWEVNKPTNPDNFGTVITTDPAMYLNSKGELMRGEK